MNDATAASTEDGEIQPTDSTEITTSSATGDTTGENPTSGTSAATDGDDEDVKSEASDGKMIDAGKVNEIVKRRVEQVRAKTKEEAQKAAQEEIDFWQAKAKEQKVETVLATLPPKPEPGNYGSNPLQYEKDLDKWTRQKVELESYTANIQRQYVERSKVFEKDKPDFNKSVQFFNSVTVSPAVMSSILESEQGPALSYYFSKNFKEFDRINKLSPVSVAREIGKLELKLTGQLKEDSAPVQKKQAPPKPTTPVTGTAPTSNQTGGPIKDMNKFIADRKKAHAANRIIR